MRLLRPKIIVPGEGQRVLDFSYSLPDTTTIQGVSEFERERLHRVLAHATVGRNFGNNEQTARAWDIAGRAPRMSDAQLARELHDAGYRYRQLTFDLASAFAVAKTNTMVHRERKTSLEQIVDQIWNPDDPETIRFILETMPDLALSQKYIEIGYMLSTLPADELVAYALREGLTKLEEEKLDQEKNYATYMKYLDDTRRWIFMRRLNRMICGQSANDAIASDIAQRQGNIQDVLDRYKAAHPSMKSVSRRTRCQ
jgi:hypothetical protein